MKQLKSEILKPRETDGFSGSRKLQKFSWLHFSTKVKK